MPVPEGAPPVTGLGRQLPGDGALMLLADGRFPSGGHTHSNGYEPVDRMVGLDNPDAIGDFVVNRLLTSGRSDAAMIAVIVRRLASLPVDWDRIDAEVEARLPSPALRDRSRALGRQWLRAGRRLWTDGDTAMPTSGPDGPHEVVAFAAVAHAAGLDPRRAALVHLHHLVSGITTAAVRLRGLDPYALQAVQLRALETVERLADEAAAADEVPLADLPAVSGPLFELLAEDHATWDNRLFQS